MRSPRRPVARRLLIVAVVVLAGCSGAAGGEPEWYYHFVCNGDPECLSTNFAGAAFGTSHQGPGQAGVSGCNGLLHFGNNFWNIPPAQQWCDNSPGLNPPPTPAVTVSLAPSTIDAGESATLSWASTLVTSCTAGGAWSGEKGTSGSELVAPPSPGSYRYSLTCTGPGGPVSGSATLTVAVPPPSVKLSLSPATITEGQPATLTWTTWQYTACSASGPWSGSKPLNGSQSVSPPLSAGTYTYTLSCLSAANGSGSGSATLTVAPASGPAPGAAPTVSLSATTAYPFCIDSGHEVTLDWSSTGASSCTASGAWAGPLAPSGSASLHPGAASATAYSTFEYAVNCSGSGGSAGATTTVCVVPPGGSMPPPPPTVSLAVTPVSISLGESATLEWSSRYASSCTAYDAWTGLQSLAGTSSVTPQSTGVFTFHLVCKGYQGSASATATLSVQVAAGTEPLAARFCNPLGLAIDAADDLYVADSGNSTIRKISHDGVVSTVAGLANYPGFVDGPGASARFNAPAGVGADATGKIFVGDSYTIRQIASDGFVTTLAGDPGNPGGADGTGPAASFWLPYGVAPDASGNVYVADYGYGSIRKVTPEGVVTTIAGLSLSGGSADGTGPDARFLGPSGLVVLPSGDIYVADQGNHTIRKIAPGAAGSVVVSTFAGTAGVQGSADGAGAAASFHRPFGIAVDSQGNLFVTDHYNRKIRKITPEGVVSTFAGSGVHDSGDGTGTAASFRYPAGIAIDSADNVYVAEGNAIRKITPAGVVNTFAGQSAALCGSNN